jgi:hypothetical protein
MNIRVLFFYLPMFCNLFKLYVLLYGRVNYFLKAGDIYNQLILVTMII